MFENEEKILTPLTQNSKMSFMSPMEMIQNNFFIEQFVKEEDWEIYLLKQEIKRLRKTLTGIMVKAFDECENILDHYEESKRK